MKRSFDKVEGVYQCTRSKRVKLTVPENIHRLWVSASSLYNYMRGDPLCDFLERRTASPLLAPRSLNDNLQSFRMKKGMEFEDDIVKEISGCVHDVMKFEHSLEPDNINRVIEAMQNGVPFLHGAPLVCTKRGWKGYADLLVRHDYLQQLSNQSSNELGVATMGASKLRNGFHYVVVDIKYSKLRMTANGVNLQNGDGQRFYKAQLYMYNTILGALQGYQPHRSYVLGRGWTSVHGGGSSPFEKLGVVDFRGNDKKLLPVFRKAIKWVRDVSANKDSWSLHPPSRPELYPNLCVDSGPRHNETKARLARELKDITMIWNCGTDNRNKAFENGVQNWDDPRCTAEILGHKGRRAHIIDSILDINRSRTQNISIDLLSDDCSLREDVKEVFVDFETTSDMSYDRTNVRDQSSTSIIFMIGVGEKDSRGNWSYESFVASEDSPEGEFDVMNRFHDYMRVRGMPRAYYWHADQRFWIRAENRQYDRLVSEGDDRSYDLSGWSAIDWVDLNSIFMQEPITLKGCFDFKLKNIVSAMRRNGMIDTQLTSGVQDGLTAMLVAKECYASHPDPVTSGVMKDIAAYNQFDCKALYDIAAYLRTHHT